MKSILQDEKACYITGGKHHLQKHHIYFGPNRKISEDHGFWVWLSMELHTGSSMAVHGNNGHDLDMKLKQDCQRKYEETHTRDEFMRLIGRNYLDW